MPMINSATRLLRPKIAGEAFQVIRRQETVNSYGESTTTNTTLDAVGGITPTAENSLVREDAFQTQSKTIRVITTFRLQAMGIGADGNKYQPDLILWHGDYYVIKTLNDWSSYGIGFVEADCASIDYEDQIEP